MVGIDLYQTLHEEVASWRRKLHEHPELDFKVHKTAAFVADKLESFGIDSIETGIAETGVVAVINGSLGPGPTIALRADMDALPIHEETGKNWASKVPGIMHACGHDGHTAMLLGAAKYLAENRTFHGSVVLIFQPAEEDGPNGVTGGQMMVREGIMERYDISRVFGMHNMPGIDVGSFAIRNGCMLASQDDFDIVVRGRGGHAAMPHLAVDPVSISAQIILALQVLITRCSDARLPLVISVTKLSAGETYNVIPAQVALAGTVRTVSPPLRDFAEQQICAVAKGIAETFGAKIEYKYSRAVPATINRSEETYLAALAARSLVGADRVEDNTDVVMGAEDFAYLADARPGAFIFIGNGSSASLHNPAYDFDDDAIPYGIGYWVNLVESVLGGKADLHCLQEGA